MASPTCRRNTRALAVFWSLMVGCGVLTAVCVHLAGRELDRPWAGFSLNAFGHVMQAHNTGLVFFDTILAVEGQPVQRHAGSGEAIREVIRRTPVGTPLTYRTRRGETALEVVVPVQQTTWRRLIMEFGMPLLVALGQLGMGALVFLLRPNTPRSWRFLGFCVVWFGFFMTIFDFQSTHVFTHFWVLTLFLPLSITYAILRYNLFDLSVMVRRTLTYGVLTALVIGAYLLLIWILNTSCAGYTLLPNGRLPSPLWAGRAVWAQPVACTGAAHAGSHLFPHPLRFSSDHPDAESGLDGTARPGRVLAR